MFDQVLCSVSGKRNAIDIIVFVQAKKDPQAGLGEDYVRRLERDVIPGDIPARTSQPI
jgi:hypothetical protein